MNSRWLPFFIVMGWLLGFILVVFGIAYVFDLILGW